MDRANAFQGEQATGLHTARVRPRFCVVSETALFAYKCTGPYNAESELTVAWNDPQIGIEWPVDQPSLSAKDAAAPCLADMDPDLLPRYPGGAG